MNIQIDMINILLSVYQSYVVYVCRLYLLSRQIYTDIQFGYINLMIFMQMKNRFHSKFICHFILKCAAVKI